jgi:hypothetical protein
VARSHLHPRRSQGERDSGLWNQRHVDEANDFAFLDVLERIVNRTVAPGLIACWRPRNTSPHRSLPVQNPRVFLHEHVQEGARLGIDLFGFVGRDVAMHGFVPRLRRSF